MIMKKTFNIIAKSVAMLLVAFNLNACLEKLPGDYILEEDAMKTFNDAEQTLTGIYSSFMSGALYSGYLTLCPDIQSDLVYAIDGYSNTLGNHWLWKIYSTNSEIESIYASLYAVIGKCNFYLDQVEDVRSALTDDTQIKYLDYYTGEVYCARALAYSELVKCFCKAYDPATAENEQGIVIRSKYFEKEPVKRASLKESYEFILSDLAKAQELLEDENDYYNSAFFTKAASHAINARVALYMQDWDEAVAQSSKVIDNEYGGFELATTSMYSGGMTYLDYLWNYDSSFEVIWKIGYTQTSYGYPTGSVFLNFTNDYTYYYPDYVPAQWVLNLYGSGDARYNAYFANLQTGYSHQLQWPLLVKYYGNQDLVAVYVYHTNMPKPLRLAEQYLIRAEANCRKGDFVKASDDLSTLRRSRYTSGGAISVNENNWLQTISDERVRELYMEGFRLHDLKRWNMGFERTPQANSLAEGSTMKVEAGDPLFVWPIPKHEIEAPGSEITGNESNK
jgi:hypothetical protein